MASSLIAGAISLILILVAGYVIATGILMIAETTITTQIDVAEAEEQRLQSSISISGNYTGEDWVVLHILNSGRSIYGPSDIGKMDLFIYDGSSTMNRYTTSSSPAFAYTLITDLVNHNMWDPGETIEIRINGSITPEWAKFVTSNGVYASMIV